MKKYIVIAAFSVLGGVIGSIVFQGSVVYAEARNMRLGQVQSYNQSNTRAGYYGPGGEQQGQIFLFDSDGGMRVQMGAYGRGGERGQSLFGLHDRQDKLRFLARMHGRTDAPTLIFKDAQGRDKIVMGIDPNTQDPYLKVTDSNNQVNDLFAQ